MKGKTKKQEVSNLGNSRPRDRTTLAMTPIAIGQPLGLVVDSGRQMTAPGKLASHSLRESEMLCRSLAIRKPVSRSVGRFRWKVVEMQLPQEIPPRQQKHWNLHQQLQQIRKPRLSYCRSLAIRKPVSRSEGRFRWKWWKCSCLRRSRRDSRSTGTSTSNSSRSGKQGFSG